MHHGTLSIRTVGSHRAAPHACLWNAGLSEDICGGARQSEWVDGRMAIGSSGYRVAAVVVCHATRSLVHLCGNNGLGIGLEQILDCATVAVLAFPASPFDPSASRSV